MYPCCGCIYGCCWPYGLPYCCGCPYPALFWPYDGLEDPEDPKPNMDLNLLDFDCLAYQWSVQTSALSSTYLLWWWHRAVWTGLRHWGVVTRRIRWSTCCLRRWSSWRRKRTLRLLVVARIVQWMYPYAHRRFNVGIYIKWSVILGIKILYPSLW